MSMGNFPPQRLLLMCNLWRGLSPDLRTYQDLAHVFRSCFGSQTLEKTKAWWAIFPPKKKYLATPPPPQIPRKHPPSPSPPHPHPPGRPPPPLLGFSITNRPSLSRLLGLPFPLPEQKKKKNIRNVHQERVSEMACSSRANVRFVRNS